MELQLLALHWDVGLQLSSLGWSLITKTIPMPREAASAAAAGTAALTPTKTDML